MYITLRYVRRPPVCPSVCLSVDHSIKLCCCGQQQIVLLWSGRQEISIDCCTAHSCAAVKCGQCHVVSVRSS